MTWEECSLRAWLNSGKTPERKDGRAFDYTQDQDSFLNRFSEKDREQIAEKRLPNPCMAYTPIDGPDIHTPGGNATTDKVFLLSIDELLDIFGVRRDGDRDVVKGVDQVSGLRVIPTDTSWYSEYEKSWDKWLEKQIPWSDKLIVCDEKQTFWWWLRSPGLNPYYAATVDSAGCVYLSGNGTFRAAGGVRPALWLNL